jgi:hypothetical protein
LNMPHINNITKPMPPQIPFATSMRKKKACKSILGMCVQQ